MARKKIFKGVVIEEFKLGYGGERGTVTYKVGDKFETTNKLQLQRLINIKKIK